MDMNNILRRRHKHYSQEYFWMGFVNSEVEYFMYINEYHINNNLIYQSYEVMDPIPIQIILVVDTRRWYEGWTTVLYPELL